ncbi:MAG: hypothetical protein ACJ0BK_06625 [Coraliomargaritaceae bacterium]
MRGVSYFILWFIGLVGLVVFFLAPDGLNEPMLLILSILAFVAYLVTMNFIRLTSSVFSWFSFFNMFSVSMLIVNFQFPALCYFVPEIAESRFLWHQFIYANSCTALSLVGYVFFLLAYMSTIWKSTIKLGPRQVGCVSPDELRGFGHKGAVVAWLLFALFIITVGPVYLSGAYDGTKNWAGGATYIFILFQITMFTVIAIDIYAIKLRHPSLGVFGYLLALNKPMLLLSIIFALLNIYTGERGVVVQIGLLYGGAFTFYFRKLSFTWFAAALCLGAMLMSFMSLYRTREASVSIQERVETGKYRSEELKWYSYTSDLAGSVRINNAAMQYFGDSLFLGRTMLVEAGSAVPFLAGAMAKTSNWTGLGGNGSHYYTQLLSPLTDKGNQTGAGNTIFGDIYMNFKWPGILIMFPAIGFLCAHIESQAKNNISIFYNVQYMILLTWAVYWPRSAYFGPTRSLLWAMIITYIAYKIMKGSRVASRPRALRH